MRSGPAAIEEAYTAIATLMHDVSAAVKQVSSMNAGNDRRAQ